VKTFPNSALKTTLVLVAALSLTLGVGAAPPPNLPPVPATVSSITPEELRMHLRFLASDELGGRYTLAPNFAIAARYLAAHLEAYGYRGVGDKGGFLQSFDVVSMRPESAKSSLELIFGDKTGTYGLGDFFLSRSGSSGSAEGQIVFVGAGVSSSAQKHDD